MCSLNLIETILDKFSENFLKIMTKKESFTKRAIQSFKETVQSVIPHIRTSIAILLNIKQEDKLNIDRFINQDMNCFTVELMEILK